MTTVEMLAFIPAGIGLTMFSWLWLRQNKMSARLDDTYTKGETKEMIDLKNKPMQDALDRNTKVSHELAQAIQELKIELAKMNKG